MWGSVASSPGRSSSRSESELLGEREASPGRPSARPPLRPHVSRAGCLFRAQIGFPAKHQGWSPSDPIQGRAPCPDLSRVPLPEAQSSRGLEGSGVLPTGSACGRGAPPSPSTGARLRMARTVAGHGCGGRGGGDGQGRPPPQAAPVPASEHEYFPLGITRGVPSPALPVGILRDLRAGREGGISDQQGVEPHRARAREETERDGVLEGP